MYPSNPLNNVQRALIHDLARNRAKALRHEAIENFWNNISSHCATAFQVLTRAFGSGLNRCTAHVARRFRTFAGV